MIRISQENYQKIVDHARVEFLHEACGLIAGKIEGADKRIEKVYLLTNIDHSGDHLSLDPKEQLEAVRNMRLLGYLSFGNWHSHPETPSRPSGDDKRLAYD